MFVIHSLWYIAANGFLFVRFNNYVAPCNMCVLCVKG